MTDERKTLHLPAKEAAAPKQEEESVSDRTPRDINAHDTRPTDSWTPPSQLPAPKPMPGWDFRYIRVSSLGISDSRNVSKRFREGWIPVLAKDHPELQVWKDPNTRFPENVEIGGTLLCKIETAKMEQRRAYQRNLANSQMDAVDNTYMRENDPRMPLLSPERKTQSNFGSG